MKTTSTLRHFLLIAGSSLMAVSAASAQNVSNTWDQNTDGNWTTVTNWVGNTAYASGTGNTATFGNFIGADRTVTLDAPITIGNITASDTSHNYIISGANTLNLDVNTGTPIIDVTTSTRNLTISSQISGNEGLQKNGSGALTLSGDNIYSGVTSITGAILISHSNALGASGVGNHTTITATGATAHLRLSGDINSAENITINGATDTTGFVAAIRNTSGTNTLSGNITLDNPSGAIRLGSEDGSLTFSGNISQIGTSQSLRFQARNSGSSITVNNAIANNGGGLNIYGNGLKDTSSGSVTLKGVSGSGIGNTEVSQNGTLILGVTNALNTIGNVTLGASGGAATGRDVATFDLAGYNQTINALNSVSVVTDNSYRKIINSGGGTSTLTVGNGDGSGTLNGQINGDIKLIKTGGGTQTLNGDNTYTGATTVSGGTLLVNGSTASGSTVGVDSGGTLGGTGTIGGAVNVTGQLSPGASIETLATGALSMLDGSTLVHELDSSMADAVGSDLLKVTGNLSLTGTVTLTLADLAVTDAPFAMNDKFSLINYTGTWNGGLFTFGGNELTDEEIFSFGLNTWKISYNDAEGGLNYTSEYAGTTDSFVNITAMTAIPEPGAALLGGIGVVFLLRRRR